MHVLIIEDNSATLFLLKRMLRISNCEITSFRRAEKALKALPTIQPDLALVDIQLAGLLNGLDFIRKVRENDTTLPIFAMTAYALDSEKQKCIDAGCTEYIAKPFNVRHLTQLLAQYLSDTSANAMV